MTLFRARRQGRATVRAAVAVVLGVAALGLGAGCSAPPPPAPAATTCKLPDPRPALVPGSLRLPADPSVLILGDSYTQGYGAEPETKGYAYLVGKPLGWRVTVAGVGGTGYVNPGKNDAGTFLQRLPTLRGRTFDLVVLQGSSNDHDVGYPELHDAVSRTVDAVRAEFPGTVVVILGPSTPYGKPDPTRVLVQCVLAWYATQQHLTFIDPIGERWFVDGDSKRYANPANGHPSNAGYRQIARRFEADVRVLQGSPEPS
jgi:acyl-CoA thioesterase-1